ncbi:hypothetical protein [Pseudochelatococcus sp. G4_1912]|uniref:hypothetical protein n=1 Tax=Pseudochelatococcus sp. G4_1912 TaxID=3114288 RepID=UPI0039C5B8DC
MSMSLPPSPSHSMSDSTRDTPLYPDLTNNAKPTLPANTIDPITNRVRIHSATSAPQRGHHRKSTAFFGESVNDSITIEARRVSVLSTTNTSPATKNSANNSLEIELQTLNDESLVIPQTPPPSPNSARAAAVIPMNIESDIEITDSDTVFDARMTVSKTVSMDEFFKHLQTAEDILDKGRGYLQSLQELGLKDGLLTKLSNNLDQIKDVIDRAQDLKQKIDNREILDAALAVSALGKELQEAGEALKSLFAEAVDKIDELKSCCSGLFSCFGKKK